MKAFSKHFPKIDKIHIITFNRIHNSLFQSLHIIPYCLTRILMDLIVNITYMSEEGESDF